MMPLVAACVALDINRRLNRALRASRDSIGDINAQVEDTWPGIRVVKSFTNEAIESKKFAYENNRFVAGRREVLRKRCLVL